MLVVGQGSHFENAPVVYPLVKTGRGKRKVYYRLTTEVTGYEDSPGSLVDAFHIEVNLCLEDLDRIAWGEVAAVHTHTRYLHPNESCLGPQNVPDAVIGVAHKDPSPP